MASFTLAPCCGAKKAPPKRWRIIFPPQEEVTKNEFTVEKEETQKPVNYGMIKAYCIAQHNTLQCINK
jgi:hypothetical protein